MSDSAGLSFPTSLGTSTADQIRLLGQDLTADLMGKVSFGELQGESHGPLLTLRAIDPRLHAVDVEAEVVPLRPQQGSAPARLVRLYAAQLCSDGRRDALQAVRARL